uniref:NADH-ubiquinone oxidoreductase chain 6 n=1 Tax=Scyllarides latus TaxID=204053 RepID=L0E8V8_SCYLT|nr:NADH dehydrogenase subunit 6 [Scyllarides latus]AGA56125.1 NADH dehydrogenase subunit 6 [Scyllarides latus]
MLMIFLPLIFFMSILFMQLSHPLSAGITLLIQTSLVALASGLISSSFWFSYVLFLIFLGGMLVLFIYVASLASNEAFKVSLTLSMLILSITLTVSFFLFFLDPIISHNNPLLNTATLFLSNQFQSTPFSIYQIYNFPATTLTLFVILYLLLTLIVVVKITAVSFGPLRFSK